MGGAVRFRIGGQGSPVVLLHGCVETGHMWRPIMAQWRTVGVPDQRRRGSAKPAGGDDKKSMAVDAQALLASLEAGPRRHRGPRHADGRVFLPGIGNCEDVRRDLWHVHFFYGDVPPAPVRGRERVYLEHFW